MKQSQENGRFLDKSYKVENRAPNSKLAKFTKEYKSPEQSKYNMTSFTDMVKIKSKSKIEKPSKAGAVARPAATKARPKYSYLTSNTKKQQVKAVKHHEIDLLNSEKEIKLSGSGGLVSQATKGRKAISNQKERLGLLHKLTADVEQRDSAVNSNYKVRDKFKINRTLSNMHSK